MCIRSGATHLESNWKLCMGCVAVKWGLAYMQGGEKMAGTYGWCLPSFLKHRRMARYAAQEGCAPDLCAARSCHQRPAWQPGRRLHWGAMLHRHDTLRAERDFRATYPAPLSCRGEGENAMSFSADAAVLPRWDLRDVGGK